MGQAVFLNKKIFVMTFEKELTSIEMLENRISEAHAAYHFAFDEAQEVDARLDNAMLAVEKLSKQAGEADVCVKAAESAYNALRAKYKALVQLK